MEKAALWVLGGIAAAMLCGCGHDSNSGETASASIVAPEQPSSNAGSAVELDVDGTTYYLHVPPESDRKITAFLNNKKNAEIRDIDVTRLTLGQTLKKVGKLEAGEYIVGRCEGGYSRVPFPLDAIDFIIDNENTELKSESDAVRLYEKNESMHEICMDQAKKFVERLRNVGSENLKYFELR